MSVEQSQSFPLRTEQVIRQKTKNKAKATGDGKGKSGRPPGSKNRDKTQVNLSSELLQIKGMITALRVLIGGLFSLNYLLLDGHFGNNKGLANGTASWTSSDQ